MLAAHIALLCSILIAHHEWNHVKQSKSESLNANLVSGFHILALPSLAYNVWDTSSGAKFWISDLFSGFNVSVLQLLACDVWNHFKRSQNLSFCIQRFWGHSLQCHEMILIRPNLGLCNPMFSLHSTWYLESVNQTNGASLHSVLALESIACKVMK